MVEQVYLSTALPCICLVSVESVVFISPLLPPSTFLSRRGCPDAFQPCANMLLLCRTTGLSIWRLLLLNKRFNASAEDRYELSIKAVMCSVIEANLAIFCANIPTLGYQLFLSWFRTHKYGDFSGESRRVMTIGSGQKLNNRPEYWELDENVAERHWRPRSRNIDF